MLLLILLAIFGSIFWCGKRSAQRRPEVNAESEHLDKPDNTGDPSKASNMRRLFQRAVSAFQKAELGTISEQIIEIGSPRIGYEVSELEGERKTVELETETREGATSV